MLIRRTKNFQKNIEKLPLEIREIFKNQERILEKNWLDSRLHIKRVKILPGTYSLRITRRYRALFYFRAEDIILFAIGHRKEIYK